MTERSVQIWFQNNRAKQKKFHKYKYVANSGYLSGPGLGMGGCDANINMYQQQNGVKGDVGIAGVTTRMLSYIQLSCSTLTIGSWKRICFQSQPPDLSVFYTPADSTLTYIVNPEDGHAYRMTIPFRNVECVTLQQLFTQSLPSASSGSSGSGDLLSPHTVSATSTTSSGSDSLMSPTGLAYDQMAVVVVTLKARPAFSILGSSQSDINTAWRSFDDFTENQQASTVLTHEIIGPAMLLEKQLRQMYSFQPGKVHVSPFLSSPASAATSATSEPGIVPPENETFVAVDGTLMQEPTQLGSDGMDMNQMEEADTKENILVAPVPEFMTMHTTTSVTPGFVKMSPTSSTANNVPSLWIPPQFAPHRRMSKSTPAIPHGKLAKQAVATENYNNNHDSLDRSKYAGQGSSIAPSAVAAATAATAWSTPSITPTDKTADALLDFDFHQSLYANIDPTFADLSMAAMLGTPAMAVNGTNVPREINDTAKLNPALLSPGLSGSSEDEHFKPQVDLVRNNGNQNTGTPNANVVPSNMTISPTHKVLSTQNVSPLDVKAANTPKASPSMHNFPETASSSHKLNSSMDLYTMDTIGSSSLDTTTSTPALLSAAASSSTVGQDMVSNLGNADFAAELKFPFDEDAFSTLTTPSVTPFLA